MIDWAAPALTQRVRVDTLDRKRNLTGELAGVRAWRRERNIYASPRTNASLDLTVRQRIDFLKTSVRFWVDVETPQGERGSWPLFTGIASVSGEGRADTGSPVTLKLADYSTLLDVPLGKHFTVLAGAFPTTIIRQLLESVGAWDAAITESSAVTATDQTWPATATKRRVVNDLLAALRYRAVWADDWGKLHAEPYVRPSSRPVTELGFIHGKTCTYQPQFTIEHDLSDVPNHAILSIRTKEPYPPAVGEAWLPADHPLSMESRDLEVPYMAEGVEVAAVDIVDNPSSAQIAAYLAALTAAGNQAAEQALLERSTPSRSYVVQNRWRPQDLDQVARFVAPARGVLPGIDTRVSIAKDSVTYKSGEPLDVSTVLQEVTE